MDPRGIWTATVDSDLEGQRVFLRVRAKAWPELSLSCELSHSLPALKNLPQHSRVSVTARAGKQRYETEGVLQMEGCAVRGRGLVDSHAGLRGSLLYLNNCSVVQVNNHVSHTSAVTPFLADLVTLCGRSGAVPTAWSPLGSWPSLPLSWNAKCLWQRTAQKYRHQRL